MFFLIELGGFILFDGYPQTMDNRFLCIRYPIYPHILTQNRNLIPILNHRAFERGFLSNFEMYFVDKSIFALGGTNERF